MMDIWHTNQNGKTKQGGSQKKETTNAISIIKNKHACRTTKNTKKTAESMYWLVNKKHE